MFVHSTLSCITSAVLAAGALLLLAACGSPGKDEPEPIRRFEWFSLLNGDDIRGSCGSRSGASTDRYRFVYNARYTQHLRVYDLIQKQDGTIVLVSRVQLAENLSHIIITDFNSVRNLLLDPRGMTSATSQLSEEERDRLLSALSESGLEERPPVGQWLDSRAYYWIAVGCRDGQILFNAWPYPSDRFERLTFPALLERFDRTGIPHPPPARVDPSGRLQARTGPGARQFSGVDFEVEVGETELTGWR